MASNETVEQVCEELRQFKDCDGEYVHEIEDLADEAEAAHKREVGELKGDRKGLLRANESLASDNTRLREENERLRGLVKEMADVLELLACTVDCDECDAMVGGRTDACREVRARHDALIVKAREVVK